MIYEVVIIGGGFGGLYAAKTLKNNLVNVTLIDRRNFHLFQPLLYQVATGGLSPADIAFPLRSIFKKQNNLKVILDEVTDIDPKEKTVSISSQKISYHFLVISAGSQHHYYTNNSWQKYAPGLKSIEEATLIRSKILLAFEKAEVENDPNKRNMFLTFIIIGGGPTGVEMAGAIAELSRETLQKDFRNINPSDARIIILEGANQILPSYPPDLSERAAKRLIRLGIEILTNSIVHEVTKNKAIVESAGALTEFTASTIIWAAGTQSSPLGELLVKKTGSETDKSGRIVVTPHCNLPGYPDIFVIGDIAHFKEKTGTPLPATASVAMQQGYYSAKTIKQLIDAKKTKPFHYFDKGTLAVIGRANAVAFRKNLKCSGYFAWLIWLFVHLLYLVGFENRILVVIQWAFNYVTRNRGARLITQWELLPQKKKILR